VSNAIRSNDHPCWVLREADGSDLDDGYEISHYSSRENAQAAADNWGTECPAPHPVQLDQPCLVAAALCGYLFGTDGDGIEHHDDPQVLLDAAIEAGWRHGPDGTLLCNGDDCDCASLPVPEHDEFPGQLALIGAHIPLGTHSWL
jgi:hypothetical protein